MIKDYYYLLGLPRGAPLNDIKQAYRKLAAQYHPDRVAGMSPEVQQDATAKMMELNEAIAILTDPDRRAEYDEQVELIPERKPRADGEPGWAAPKRDARRPSSPPPPPRPAAATQPPPAAAAQSAFSPQPSASAAPPPPPAAPAAEAPPPSPPVHGETVQGKPAAEPAPAPSTPPRGMLAEEFVRKLRGTLRKLPLNWKDAELRGWQWSLAGGSWRRAIVVAHRHLETLSLLSLRTVQSAVQGLLDSHKTALRPTDIFVLLSYDRLMDAKAVQEQLPAVAAAGGGWLKNVRAMLVLYDGQRAALFGTPGDDQDAQRVVRVLLGR